MVGHSGHSMRGRPTDRGVHTFALSVRWLAFKGGSGRNLLETPKGFQEQISHQTSLGGN